MIYLIFATWLDIYLVFRPLPPPQPGDPRLGRNFLIMKYI